MNVYDEKRKLLLFSQDQASAICLADKRARNERCNMLDCTSPRPPRSEARAELLASTLRRK
jgi:hypothetical protein